MKNPELIKSTVEKLIAELAVKNAGCVKKAWSQSVDEDSLAHAFPVSLVDGKLTVVVDSPVRLHGLSLRKKEILCRLRAVQGGERVKEIRFRLGTGV